MKPNHHIGNSDHFLSTPSPRNPLLSGFPLAHPLGLPDVLSNCADVLATLADLFGDNPETRGYKVLGNKATCYGYWLQLQGVISLLKEAAKVATVEKAESVYEEMTLAFPESSYAKLKSLANQQGLSVESFIESTIENRVKSWVAP